MNRRVCEGLRPGGGGGCGCPAAGLGAELPARSPAAAGPTFPPRRKCTACQEATVTRHSSCCHVVQGGFNRALPEEKTGQKVGIQWLKS